MVSALRAGRILTKTGRAEIIMFSTGQILRRSALCAGLCAAVAIGAAPRAASQAAAPAAVGVDLAGMDTAVAPGDDFFRYANGTWDRTTTIPPDRSSWGLDAQLVETAAERTRALLEDAGQNAAAGSDTRKAGEYYAAYMDESAIDALGIAPLKTDLDRIAAIANRSQLAAVIGAGIRNDVDPLNDTNMHTDRLFGVFIAQDFNEPSRNAAYLLQGGIGLPDREYYLADNPHMQALRDKYQAHIVHVLQLAKITDAGAKAERIFGLEMKIAKAHESREDSEDVHKANNPWPRADFGTKAPGIDWAAFFKAAGLDAQPQLIAWQPAAIEGESALVASEPLETWKEYLQFALIDHWSSLLPKAFVEERFDLFGKALSGTPQMPVRWKRGVAATNDAVGDAVGRLYVARYFPPEAKAKAQAMAADLKAAFAARIKKLDWMSPQTRAKAQAKLDTLIVGVGYPDKWRDYGALTVSRGEALQNAMRAEAFRYKQAVATLHGPIDRREWWMTPQTVNAVNLPIQNALNFPAAILQPPYFDPRAAAAHNYGAIGAVIGHEISHSFDDQGSQFDASGRLANWWTPEDFAHFKAAAAQLVAQYNAYRPLPDLGVNGQQTLSENIADVAGLSAAYDAYRLTLKGREAPARQGFSGDQQFFVSFAQSWRDKFREPLLRQLLLTDGHAPSEYRADTVRNLDAWYAAFKVPATAKLYLAAPDRVRVW
jgi:putative endopeptidase